MIVILSKMNKAILLDLTWEGSEFKLEDGSVVRSANITPHATGIGNWSTEMFVQRFSSIENNHLTPE